MTVAEPTVGELRATLRAVEQAWGRVVEDGPVVTRRLSIAGIDVEVALAGAELTDALLPAFDGLELAEGPVRGTVGAWDAAATGIRIPEHPAGSPGPPYRATVRRDGRPVAEIEWSNLGFVRTGNRDSGLYLLAAPRAAVLLHWEVGTPLRRQLRWVLSPEVLFVHAGAVGDESGAALLMGSSGAGKSSTALACFRAGMGFLSDDYCLVRDDPPVVHRIHATARVFDDDAHHFGDFLEPVTVGASVCERDPTEEPKALFRISTDGPGRMLASAPVRVILLPERGEDRRPRLEPIGAGEALRRVAPSMLHQMSLEPDRELAQLRRLLTSVPCYRLVLSPDRRANPIAVQEAIGAASSAPS